MRFGYPDGQASPNIPALRTNSEYTIWGSQPVLMVLAARGAGAFLLGLGFRRACFFSRKRWAFAETSDDIPNDVQNFAMSVEFTGKGCCRFMPVSLPGPARQTLREGIRSQKTG